MKKIKSTIEPDEDDVMNSKGKMGKSDSDADNKTASKTAWHHPMKLNKGK